MRRLLISLSALFALFAAPAFGGPLPGAISRPAAVDKPVAQVRVVTRCHVVRVWRHGPRGRHLVPVRRCRRVRVR